MAIFPIGAKVGADTTAFVSSMGAATLGLKAFTGGAALAGAAIGVGLAVGIGTSVNAAREFQVELVKLNTLVGIQIEQIQEWEGSIKDLAVETGRMPVDLARAMFAITSGGARGTRALELLEFSAKASAQGLGDMTSIGRTATAMLQAFADQGLSSEKAIDIMVATVRDGNLEASSLATAFSRVLGPAKALGSSVEDIGGFLATFTRLGGSTEEAATGLVNVFNLLIKTPKDVRDSMEEMGFSIEEVRQTIAEDGLVAGLALMKEGIGDNIDVLGEMIPNVRALIGFLNTAGLQSEDFAAITDRITNSLGLNAEGFDVWSESADAAQSRFGAQLKVLATTIGEAFLPPLNAVLDKMGEWLGVVNEVIATMDEVAGPSDKATAAIERFAGAVGRFDPDTLQRQQAFIRGQFRDTAQELGDLNAELAEIEGRRPSDVKQVDLVRRFELINAIAELSEQRDIELGKLALLQEALAKLTETQEEESDAVERSVGLSEEDADAIEKRQEAVRGLVTTLQDELLVLREGQAALVDQQLVDLEASIFTRIRVAGLLAQIEAERELAVATRETAREKEQAAKAEERRLETLKAKREREAATRTRALERADLARLNAEMQEATQIAQEMADTIGNAFDSIVDGTAGVADAFERMVTDILRQIQRLLIQRTIVEPLLNLILGQIGPTGVQTGGGAGAIIDTGGFDAVAGTAASVAAPGGRGGQTVFVQQTLNFPTSMIDQQSGDAFIQKHGPRIARIIADGVSESGDLAAALRQ